MAPPNHPQAAPALGLLLARARATEQTWRMLTLSRFSTGCLIVALAACRSNTTSTDTGSSASPACDTPAGTTTALLDGSYYAYALAVDDAYVYAATPGGVWRVPRTGGAPVQLGGSGEAVAIAIDGQNAYYTGNYAQGSGPKPMSGAGLFAVPIGGGAATMLSPDAWAMQIAVDDANVYGSLTLWSVPIGGGSKTPLQQGGAPVESNAIALYGDNVYVASGPLGTSGVLTVPKTGGMPTVLVANRAHPGAIAVDATGIYWSESPYLDQSGGIFRAAPDGSGVTQLAPDDDANGLVIDADSVYWSASAVGAIRTVPKDGGNVVTLATGLAGPAGIVEHGGNVYWAEQPAQDASVSVDAQAGDDADAGAAVVTACK